MTTFPEESTTVTDGNFCKLWFIVHVDAAEDCVKVYVPVEKVSLFI
jgi:hypothetical protein